MKIKTIFILFLSFSFIQFVKSQTVDKDYRDGIVYLKVKTGGSQNLKEWQSDKDGIEALSEQPQISMLARTYCFTAIEKRFRTAALQNIYKISFSKINDIDKLVRELNSLPNTQYACKVPIYRPLFTPDDVHPNQWYMSLIQAYQAWDITLGKAYVKVAIVDDAVKISHPDLSPIIYHNTNEVLDSIDNDGNGFVDDINGWDVANNDNNPEPPVSHWMYQFSDMIFTHGTHCAGIAGAATNNGIGIASIGNGISILPVKCTADNSVLPLAIDEGPLGIDYAIAAGADVISLSWGSGTNDSVVRDAVNAALAAGIMVVAAAGNDGDTSLFYPASLDGVISVGAITKNDIIASFSQRNSKVSVMAPGDTIWSCMRKNDGYMYLEGTSMACPMVAGLIGLMKSLDTNFTNTQIKDCLLAGCDNIDALNPTATGMMGAGRINAYKSLQCLQSQQFITENKTDNALYIFPNPAENNLYITFTNTYNFTSIEIFDVMGRLMMHIPLVQGVNITQADISNLSAGVYIVDGKSNTGATIQKKFIVNKTRK